MADDMAAGAGSQGPLLSWVAPRVAAVHVFVVGMTLLALSFGALLSGNTVIVFVAAVLFAVGNGLAWPTFQSRLAAAAGEDKQGEVQGAATSAGSLASVVGLVTGGVLYPVAGTGLFVAGAAMFVLVAASASRLFAEPDES